LHFLLAFRLGSASDLSLIPRPDLDPAALGLRSLGHVQREDALPVVGGDRVALHGARQREGALEAAIAALPEMVALLFRVLLALLRLLAADREDVVLELDLDVVGIH